MADRKQILLRLDPAVHDALARWAGDELRSTTAQIEYVLRQALAQAGRLPSNVGKMPRRGRPPKDEDETTEATDTAEPNEPNEPNEPTEPPDPTPDRQPEERP